MEDTLRVFEAEIKEIGIWVLILVVMEDTLRAHGADMYGTF